MEKSDVFKISKDTARAKDLFEMAKESLNITVKLIPKSLTYKLLVEYYEIFVQFATSIMYSEGYKTLSHIELIKFLLRYKEFSRDEVRILDNMRKFRHGTVYYGRKESGNFYINHEKEIKEIINKLLNLVEEKLRISEK